MRPRQPACSLLILAPFTSHPIASYDMAVSKETPIALRTFRSMMIQTSPLTKLKAFRTRVPEPVCINSKSKPTALASSPYCTCWLAEHQVTDHHPREAITYP
ncbi:hypothetical protein Bpfe_016829 [Biomphalaria pfeifferi]|uniref:Uncharacterized protein n=1 Tax=Biomphalaria pfeifferi TaxID=112525 RepID=A0AAD8BHW8_BIOPF|nr:hypothetical protein Bpfe_016829 [Biomphalaria pfeifferi]